MAISDLNIEEKEKLISIVQTLRYANLIGLIEARDWIELIFPEFAQVRDQESDMLFLRMAQLQQGVDIEE